MSAEQVYYTINMALFSRMRHSSVSQGAAPGWSWSQRTHSGRPAAGRGRLPSSPTWCGMFYSRYTKLYGMVGWVVHCVSLVPFAQVQTCPWVWWGRLAHTDPGPSAPDYTSSPCNKECLSLIKVNITLKPIFEPGTYRPIAAPTWHRPCSQAAGRQARRRWRAAARSAPPPHSSRRQGGSPEVGGALGDRWKVTGYRWQVNSDRLRLTTDRSQISSELTSILSSEFYSCPGSCALQIPGSQKSAVKLKNQKPLEMSVVRSQE